ncbi:LysM peptidoglycan-binding domain-containing M23 family metallopeptidase [soil metagenome]
MRSPFARAVIKPFSSPLLLSAATAVLLAGCSGSVDRFSDNSSGNDPVYTASVPKSVQGGEGQSSDNDEVVTSRPLDNTSIRPRQKSYASNGYNYQQAYKPPSYKQMPEPSYQPPPAAERAMPEEQPAQRTAAAGSVRVEPGMTLYSIARGNGVTVHQLASANNIAAPYSVHVGQTLHIPGGHMAAAPESTFRSPPQQQQAEIQPANTQPRQTLSAGGMHTVKSGDTLFSLGRAYHTSPYAIADLNGLSHSASLRLGQTIRVPGGKAQGEIAASGPPAKATVRKDDGRIPQDTAQADVKQPVPGPVNEQPIASQPPANNQGQGLVADNGPALEAGGLSFRWPVKGRVISAYGSKPNGLRNEGVNISVPEGTGVRAAESGVVAYAGNELKGYGNLILIRHEGGWVTAYAHNKELFVKRGDTVKRGDVVAKAGQTGTVTSPQVHFEIRKGATAMDPMKFLGNATALN